MEWKKKWETQTGLMLLTIVIWSIFIGLCIKVGAILFASILSIFNPVVAQDLYQGLNLYELMQQNLWYYISVLSLLVTITALKAYIFYIMIRIFLKIDLMNPFSKEIYKLISKIGETSIQVAFLIFLTNAYFKWLSKKGFELHGLGEFSGGSFEFLLLGVIIYAIAKVFKRGLEIQSDNELTI
ncbi:DUF2975 domain-containing protein [Belliella sp. DSM 107340]|uniref:DUF2975 domain-containing protein n=1 Tax=Belliella calami TaxID=2923436 RepID=A0ABS9US11_9BACT|nr:DUF2975 domain-containing protein [Belliella calami]MCH7399391.1 DUF2975 domain-containing protein [Belliella calami]